MSATLPAMEFSIGIIANDAAPSLTAAKASSKLAPGQRRQMGICVSTGDVGVRAGFTLIGYEFSHTQFRSSPADRSPPQGRAPYLPKDRLCPAARRRYAFQLPERAVAPAALVFRASKPASR